jgi:hypothetical protein
MKITKTDTGWTWGSGEHSGTVLFPGDERGAPRFEWDAAIVPDDWEEIEAAVLDAIPRHADVQKAALQVVASVTEEVGTFDPEAVDLNVHVDDAIASAIGWRVSDHLPLPPPFLLAYWQDVMDTIEDMT